MENKIKALKDVENGAIELKNQMVIVKDFLNNKHLSEITKEDAEDINMKDIINNISKTLDECKELFDNHIY